MSNKRLWDLMNQVKKKALPAIETITFEGQPCNDLNSLQDALHNSYNSAENHPIDYRFLSKIPQLNTFEWLLFTNQEFKDAIAKCSPFSTLGPDHISQRHLKPIIAKEYCLDKFVDIANACISLEFWPSYFKEAKLIIIPKPNKDTYNTPKSFCPIVLLNTIGKLIEKVISNYLQFHMASNRFLDLNQLGGIRQCSTIDAGLYLIYIIQARWLKQCHTSVISFNIAQFFSSLNHSFLSICLRKASLNINIINFFNSYHSNKSTTYAWNGFVLPLFTTSIGVDQGSALSFILSAIYMAPIIKTFKK